MPTSPADPTATAADHNLEHGSDVIKVTTPATAALSARYNAVRNPSFLSLFAGIGGIDVGLENAGMTCVGQVEIDPYCQQVLARHWPGVPRHDDVRTAAEWWGDRPSPTVVAGGFPCQPFSIAGLSGGTIDGRWGWPWFADVLRRVRPRYVVVENVPALAADPDAFGWMLGDLADLGFDAEWSLLSACAVGAPHTRERLFLLAYPAGELRPSWVAQEQRGVGEASVRPGADGEHAWSRPRVWLEAARASDRVVDGLSHRMVAAGGNAVVPQVAEVIGRMIVAHAATEIAA